MKPKKPTLALNMIARDGAETIEAALDSVEGLWDEFVCVMDTRSTDNTAEIVEKRGGKVFYEDWQGFSFARNEAMRQSRSDYIFGLDCDEILKDPGDLVEVVTLASYSRPKVDAILCTVSSVGNSGTPGEVEQQLRVWRRDPSIRFLYPIHNQLRGWKQDRLAISTADFWAFYKGDMSDRHQRNLDGLLKMAEESDEGSEEWAHAMFFLVRSYAMVFDHKSCADAAEHLLRYFPDHRGYCMAWCHYLRSVLAMCDGNRAWAIINEGIKHHDRIADFWYWALAYVLHRFAGAAADPGPYFYVPQFSRKYLEKLPEAAELIGMKMAPLKRTDQGEIRAVAHEEGA